MAISISAPSRPRRRPVAALGLSRTRQRGAAMLEGLLVVVCLIIVFFCLVGVAGVYKAKLVVMQDARYQAVHNAVNNCELSGKAYAATRPPSEFGDIPTSPGGLPPKFTVDFARMIEEGAGVSRAESTGRFSYGTKPLPRSERDDPHSPPLFSPISGQVSSHSFMFCNEKAAGLNLAQVVSSLFNEVKDTLANDLVPQLKDLTGF